MSDDVEKPIAFISRALSATEQRYSTTEKESLSCVWACKRLHFYLYRRKFIQRTDLRAFLTSFFASGMGRRLLR